MSEILNTPPQLVLTYYKGTTLNRLLLLALNLDENEQEEPANLKEDFYTYRAEIRPERRARKVWATIDNQYFVLGQTNESTDVFDELYINAPAEIFEPIPEGEWEMDVFQYDSSSTPEQRNVISRYRFVIKHNVTQKPYV